MIRERRVHIVVRLARQKLQRILPSRMRPRLLRRHKHRHRRQLPAPARRPEPLRRTERQRPPLRILRQLQRHMPLPLQPLPRRSPQTTGACVIQRLIDQTHPPYRRKQASGNPIRRPSSPNSSTLFRASPSGAIAALRHLHEQMPIRSLHILRLKKRRRRQQHIRIVRRIGKELLMHHREQILAPHPPQHRILVRSHRRRIRVVHKQRLHRRPSCIPSVVSACPSSLIFTTRAARPSGLACINSGICNASELNGNDPDSRQLQPAALIPPRPRQQRQHTHRPRRRPTILAALNPIVQPNHRRPSRRPRAASHTSRASRTIASAAIPVTAAAASGECSARSACARSSANPCVALGDILRILQPLAQDHMHHRQRQQPHPSPD